MKYVYDFEEGNASMVDLLGGKGAGLAEMKRIGINVPPGFTITTEACRLFFKKGITKELRQEIIEHLKKLEEKTSKKFGDKNNPLLVSVRSGAPVSMPGMMETILNLGLNDENVNGLAAQTKNERFAYDAYRRLIQGFGSVVFEIPKNEFEEVIEKEKKKANKKFDYELDPNELKQIVEEFKRIYKKHSKEFPQDVYKQLFLAIEAVFNSWNSKKARVYREMAKLPETMGTACNIQAMVFGNFGMDSGTGVMFTRNPATGEKQIFGEVLFNAQGEEVVAGIRTPIKIEELKKTMPNIYKQIEETAEKLEKHYKDMQDVEFTIEKQKLYILQTRSGKRTAIAAIKIAWDMLNEGLINEEEAILRISPSQLETMLHKQVDPDSKKEVIAKGIGASPGAAVGKVIFDTDEAEALGRKGEDVILVRPETSPEDINGMIWSRGILTSRGGMTSHSAVVARGIGKPAVVGCESIIIKGESFIANGKVVKKGDIITIDGQTGEVILGEAKLIEPKISGELSMILKIADKIRKLGVYANANTEEDAKRAFENGAEGIGLARTERMFLGKERVNLVRKLVLAKDEKERREALSKLLPMQVEDFKRLFEIANGKPIIVRLLDPPLHEFLPNPTDLLEEIHKLEKEGKLKEAKRKRELYEKVKKMQEANPMIGFRMCRVGIVFPEIYETQTKAIVEAKKQLEKKGIKVNVKIMIPGVIERNELKLLRERITDEVGSSDIPIGTMIETPRSALTADKIAEVADFFSFGTNDLTQTTLAMSRDDAQTFLLVYLDKKILPEDPFKVLDFDGVGKLVKIGVELGRKTKKDLEIGVCGEHGGDPESIEFFNELGIDYVSCSPFRVPIARLVAAQAEIKKRRKLS